MAGASALSAGGTILGAIGGQQNAEAQTRNRNALAVRRYEDQIRSNEYRYQQEAAVYRAKLADYERGKLSVMQALRDAQLGTQLQLNQEFQAARFKQQDQLISEIGAVGRIAASGQAGRSTERAKTLMKGAYGRNLAVMQQSLEGKNTAAKIKNTQYVNKANSDLNRMYSNVGLAPMRAPDPSAPMLVDAPSRLGMFGSILGAVGSAATTIGGLDFGGSGGGGGANPNRSSLMAGYQLDSGFSMPSADSWTAGMNFKY